MSRFRIILSLCVLLLAGQAADAVTSSPSSPSRRGHARQLVQAAESALEGISQAVEDSASGFNRRDTEDVVFLANLTALRARLDLVDAAISSHDDRLFDLLDLGSADLGALRVSWARTGLKDARIAEGLRIVSSSYRTLRNQYGREGLRHRKGGALSEAEERQFRRLQRSQKRFAESLKPLRNRASQKGDETTTAELDRFRQEAERIVWAPFDLESYLNSLIAVSELRGEWGANSRYVQQTAEPADWAVANETVEDLYIDADIGHVFTVDLGSAGGWGYLDEEAEVPADAEAGGAVQVYQMTGEAEEPAAAAFEETSEIEEVEPAAPMLVYEEPLEGSLEEPAAEEPEAVEEAEPALAEEAAAEEISDELAPEATEEISEEDLPIEDLPADATDAGPAPAIPPPSRP